LTYEVAGFNEGTPVDKDGQPLVRVSFSVTNLVPTGKFANITVGPATAERYVPANLSDKELAEAIADLAKPVEWAMGHRRDQILKEISGQADAGE
jgi:hypothetical protein